ncbi:hypothetical protein SLS62_008337 [Diatrype stigma]|uniref:Oxidase ustYa n=1 Tax=Diatrype stigma TaxID=117547 RepID=A0AAN9ULS4_9PEZI
MSPGKQESNDAEEGEAFLTTTPLREDAAWAREGSSRSKVTRYLRLALEIAMAATIIALLVNPVYERIEAKTPPVPKFPRKTYRFLPDPQYVRDDMFFDERDTLHTLHNWIPLSSDARGYVQIPDHEAYSATIGQPQTVAVNRTSDGPAYMVAVFHQLHCLSYLAEHFQQGYGGIALAPEVAHHAAHCFDYLRQSVTCSADTTLEGADDDAGPGWGARHYECADYDALLAWANDHGALRWRNGLLPGEAVL